MPEMIVHVRTVHDASVAVGWAGNRTLTIDRTEQAGGTGLGYSGGELLCLAIGACYTNDIFREAAKRGIAVMSVEVDVTVEWGDGTRAQSVSYSAKVEAEASESAIQELMAHTDRIAEIHNSLRMGAPVTLASAQALPMRRTGEPANEP